MVDNQPTYALDWTYVPFDSTETTRFNGYTIAQAFPGKYNLVISDANGCRLEKSDTNPSQGIIFDGWDGANAPLPATNFIYTLQGTLLDQTIQIQRTGTFIALK